VQAAAGVVVGSTTPTPNEPAALAGRTIRSVMVVAERQEL
jgi:hypothetical protein